MTNPIIFIPSIVSYDSHSIIGVYRKRDDAVTACQDWINARLYEYHMMKSISLTDEDSVQFYNDQIEYYKDILQMVYLEEYERDWSTDSPIIEEYELQ